MHQSVVELVESMLDIIPAGDSLFIATNFYLGAVEQMLVLVFRVSAFALGSPGTGGILFSWCDLGSLQ